MFTFRFTQFLCSSSGFDFPANRLQAAQVPLNPGYSTPLSLDSETINLAFPALSYFAFVGLSPFKGRQIRVFGPIKPGQFRLPELLFEL